MFVCVWVSLLKNNWQNKLFHQSFISQESLNLVIQLNLKRYNLYFQVWKNKNQFSVCMCVCLWIYCCRKADCFYTFNKKIKLLLCFEEWNKTGKNTPIDCNPIHIRSYEYNRINVSREICWYMELIVWRQQQKKPVSIWQIIHTTNSILHNTFFQPSI